MSESFMRYGSSFPYRPDWLGDEDVSIDSALRRLRYTPPESFASLLLEAKSIQKTAAEDYSILENRASSFISHESDRITVVGNKAIGPSGFCEGWDIYDFAAVAGILIAILGLLLVLFPSTRSGSILMPIGAGVAAAATYGAQRRDLVEN